MKFFRWETLAITCISAFLLTLTACKDDPVQPVVDPGPHPYAKILGSWDWKFTLSVLGYGDSNTVGYTSIFQFNADSMHIEYRNNVAYFQQKYSFRREPYPPPPWSSDSAWILRIGPEERAGGMWYLVKFFTPDSIELMWGGQFDGRLYFVRRP